MVFLPCPGAARRQGSSQGLLDAWWPACTRVVVPPLQESVLTGEAGHPRWREELPLRWGIAWVPTGVWSRGGCRLGTSVVGFH